MTSLAALSIAQTWRRDGVCLFGVRPLLLLFLLRGAALPSRGVAVGDDGRVQVLQVGVEVQNLVLVRAQRRKSLRRESTGEDEEEVRGILGEFRNLKTKAGISLKSKLHQLRWIQNHTHTH